MGVTWAGLGAGSSSTAAAEEAAAAASELMAEARIPNWPVRVTTTKRGLLKRVPVTLAPLELAASVAVAATVPLKSLESAPEGCCEPFLFGSDEGEGLEMRDLFGRWRVAAGPAGGGTSDALESTAAAKVGELLGKTVSLLADWRIGCSVCNELRKRLEATRERSCDRASCELAAAAVWLEDDKEEDAAAAELSLSWSALLLLLLPLFVLSLGVVGCCVVWPPLAELRNKSSILIVGSVVGAGELLAGWLPAQPL